MEVYRAAKCRGSHILQTIGSQAGRRLGFETYASAALHPPPQEELLVLISVRGGVNPRAAVRLEELGKLKKFNDFTGTRIRDLPACWMVPTLCYRVSPPSLKYTFRCSFPTAGRICFYVNLTLT
jgi:hypothetical protein